jgi:hypothetical protein
MLLMDESLGRVATDILRERVIRAGRGRPDLAPVELSLPLARFGVRGRLVQGLQVHFKAPVDDLARGFLEDEQDREQLLYKGYSYAGGAVASLPGGGRYLILMLSTDLIDLDLYRREIFRLVNYVRERRGASRLSWDNGAARAAQIRAAELDRKFAHQRPTGQDWSTVLGELGVQAAEAGENLAHGQRSPYEVMRDLMDSPGHRDNIMSDSFGLVGIGCQVGDDGQLNSVQIFLRR